MGDFLNWGVESYNLLLHSNSGVDCLRVKKAKGNSEPPRSQVCILSASNGGCDTLNPCLDFPSVMDWNLAV